MNEMQKFIVPNSKKEIRVITIDNEPWFVGKDVAETLGYNDLSHAILDHVDEEDRINSKTQGQNAPEFGQRGTWLINESGLYSLILSSKLPSAKQFKRWVTAEVLPAIRKTGYYSMNSYLIEDPIERAKRWIQEQEEKKALEQSIAVQQQTIEKLSATNEVLSDDILSWADRNLIVAVLRRYGSKMGSFPLAWGDWKKELMYKYGININSRVTNYANKYGEKSKVTDMLHDEELPDALRTAVSLCQNIGVDVSDLLQSKKNLTQR